MQQVSLVFTSHEQVHKHVRDIWAMWKGQEVKGAWEIVVRPFKVKRSNPQNARLWVLHSKAAMLINMKIIESKQYSGITWTKEDMHDRFKELYCGSQKIEVNGRGIFRMKSTTEMTREEMAEAQEKYIAWLTGDLGLEIDLDN